MSIFSLKENREVGTKTASHLNTVGSLIMRMKSPVNTTVTLDEWSEYAGVSKYRLTEWFRDITGIPPITFHNAEKLEIAKRLLAQENLSVTDTCFEIGFESLGSFTTKFTTQVGVPPGHYAKIMRSTNFIELLMLALKNFQRKNSQISTSVQVEFERPFLSDGSGIIAAVFEKQIPSGYPYSWCFIPPFGKGAAFSCAVPGFCMAASMPLCPDKSDLVNFRPKLIGKVKLSNCRTPVTMKMNRPTVFDPPITLAVPALFTI